jgi:hypothetical protein
MEWIVYIYSLSNFLKDGRNIIKSRFTSQILHIRNLVSSKRGRIRSQLTGLTPPHFCVCPIPGPGFPMPYTIVVFIFNGLRCEVVIHFVEIDGIVDSLLKLSFHNTKKYVYCETTLNSISTQIRKKN